MAQHRYLTRAPVREALIDLQFEGPVSLELIDNFVGCLPKVYGQKQDLWEALFGVGANGSSVSSSSSAIGRRLDSEDGRFVVQSRASGFSVSRLNPYGTWSELRGEAAQLWTTFQSCAPDVRVARVAVRYINEIKLALPFRDFGEFFVCPPQVPKELPQSIGGFVTRIVVPDEANNCVSVVTQALDGHPTEGGGGQFITVILDVEVFREGLRLPGLSPEIWGALDVMRDQKNRLFFAHLTEKAVEMYE